MARVNRQDSWTNLATGLGDAIRDKRLVAKPHMNLLRQQEAEILWRSDDMAARIVEKIPHDAMRRGFIFSTRPDSGVKVAEDESTDEESIDGRTAQEWASEVPGAVAETRPLGPGTMGKPSRNDANGITDPTMAVAGNDDANKAKEIEQAVAGRLKKLKARQAVLEALKLERAYGGSAIFLGTVDRSRGPQKSITARKLDLNLTSELRFLTVLTPMELVPYRCYGDPLAPNYGQVAVWTMVPKSKGINPRPSVLRVHSSRLIIFGGIRTSRFMIELHRGFGDSILNRCVNHIRNFSTSYDSAAVLISDFAQAIYKMKGLVELLQADGNNMIQKRAAAMSYVRSVLNAVLIDSDEEFERKQTPVTGLPDLLDRMANRLAASSGMPVSMLMGEAPAGLNSTGEVNADWYNENVEDVQIDRAQPALERIVEVELRSTDGATKGKEPDGWNVSFPSLTTPDESEKAKNRLADAQADSAWIAAGVLHPEEVAKSRFGGDTYGSEIKLDEEVRAAALEMQNEQEDKANELHEQTIASMDEPQLPPQGGKPGKPAPGKKK